MSGVVSDVVSRAIRAGTNSGRGPEDHGGRRDPWGRWGRRVAVVVAVSALTFTGVACGGVGGDGGNGASGGTSGGSAVTLAPQDGSGFPVTIEHMFGTTTIEEPPQRVLALGMADQDIALALGITPVAMVENPDADDGLFPWSSAGRDLSGVETVPLVLDQTSVERLAALRPDLILATTAEGSEAMYDQVVDADVPIIAPLTGPMADSWQDLTLTIGEALGRTDAAEALVAETEATIDAVASDLPELEGRSFTMGVASSTSQIRAVNQPTDTVAQLFSRLGMVVAPGLATVENDTPVGSVDISFEQIELLSADSILYTGSDDAVAALEGSSLFQGLPAVERGTSYRYDGTTAYGLRVPTPLSIPWVLDELRPTLEATAAATPVAP